MTCGSLVCCGAISRGEVAHHGKRKWAASLNVYQAWWMQCGRCISLLPLPQRLPNWIMKWNENLLRAAALTESHVHIYTLKGCQDYTRLAAPTCRISSSQALSIPADLLQIYLICCHCLASSFSSYSWTGTSLFIWTGASTPCCPLLFSWQFSCFQRSKLSRIFSPCSSFISNASSARIHVSTSFIVFT